MLIHRTLSLIVSLMILLPFGLKLEHAFTFHKEPNECSSSTVHFHSSVDHSDFLDIYFFHSVSLSFSNYQTLENIKAPVLVFSLHFEFFKSFIEKLSVRGPPY